MSKDFEIKSDYQEFWKRASQYWNPYFRAADIAIKATAGRTWTNSEVERLRREGRYPQEYNIIRPLIQFFSGFARDNIKSTVVTGLEESDEKTAEQLTKLLRFIYDKENTNQILLDAFDDAIKAGMSLVGMYKDFSRDRVYGDIKFYKRSYASFIIDPDFTKQDLSDASEVILRDFITKDAAKSILPSSVDPKIIDEIAAYSKDDKFQYLRTSNFNLRNQNLIAYDQYYRRVEKDVKEIVDLDTGETIEFPKNAPDDFDERIEFAKSQGINVEIMTSKKSVVELNVIISGEVIYSGDDPIGIDDYPFVPIIAHFNPEVSDPDLKIQGISIGLVDTQRAFNKRMIRSEDLMDSAINSGALYRVGDVDIEDILQTGVGKFIPVASDKPFSEVYQQLSQGQVPPSWAQERQLLLDLSNKIANINESLLGMDEGGNTQVSGRLAEVRAANGLRSNRAIFDNFEKSQKLLGSKVIRAIQRNYSPQKIQRIINEEPTEEIQNMQFDRYDSVVKQAVLSQSQRDALYFEILRLRELFGDVIPASLAIKNLPIAGASEIKEAIEAQEMQMQQQQQQQQLLEQQERDAQMQFINANTEQALALATERRARAVSNTSLMEARAAEAEDKRSHAVLDKAKAITEIAKMEQDRLIAVLQFIESLEKKEEQDRDKVAKNIATVSSVIDAQSKQSQIPQGG